MMDINYFVSRDGLVKYLAYKIPFAPVEQQEALKVSLNNIGVGIGGGVVPDASSTVSGILKLNVGYSTGDDTDTSKALTAGGLNALATSGSANAFKSAIDSLCTALGFSKSGAAVGAATDTTPGIVSLNIGSAGGDANEQTAALTSYGFNVLASAVGAANALQAAIKDALKPYLVYIASGKIGIQRTTPTAWLHLGAGTANSGEAPLKFTSGALMTTPETGAIEYTGDAIFLTRANADRVRIAVNGWTTVYTPTYTVSAYDSTISVTVDGAVISFPSASANPGRYIVVRNTSAGDITVNGLTTQPTMIRAFQSDGLDWYTMGFITNSGLNLGSVAGDDSSMYKTLTAGGFNILAGASGAGNLLQNAIVTALSRFGLYLLALKVGIGKSLPTAWLHLRAGTANAGESPLKFDSGTLATTPEPGAIEYDGNGLYLTLGNASRIRIAADDWKTISSANYTVTGYDSTLNVITDGASISFPSAATYPNKRVVIRNTSSNDIVANGFAIPPTMILSFQSDGSNWYKMGFSTNSGLNYGDTLGDDENSSKPLTTSGLNLLTSASGAANLVQNAIVTCISRFGLYLSSQKIGIGKSAPSAFLHIKAGTATAGESPVKIDSGTLNTTPEAGAIEYIGSGLFMTFADAVRYRLGVQKFKVVSGSTYTTTIYDSTLSVTTAGCVVTLHSASSSPDKVIEVRNTSGGDITVNGQTIISATVKKLQSSGSAWFGMGYYGI